MKLSGYAKKAGVSYKTAHRWWKAGELRCYQIPTTGTIIIESDDPVITEPVALIYASQGILSRGKTKFRASND
ncbi:hypothetical protein [Nostoc sp.]|uniref:hypothetical protein n=1 Tax=Nostoc sp. TaxID=1180 RepID=UPI002FF7F5B9